MSEFGNTAVLVVLLLPAAAAAILALIADHRISTRLNVLGCALTFAAALVLLEQRPAPGPFLLIDDLNIVFVVLTTFVALSASVFSASYIDHELAIGRLTPT